LLFYFILIMWNGIGIMNVGGSACGVIHLLPRDRYMDVEWNEK